MTAEPVKRPFELAGKRVICKLDVYTLILRFDGTGNGYIKNGPQGRY